MENKENTRRRFLINTSLAALGLGFLPKSGIANGTNSQKTLADCDKTTLDYYGEGPFYTANPPEITNNKLAKASEAGTRIILTGRVKNLDCTEFIPDTVIDIWHANNNGAYDNSGFNLRGKTKSNAQGFYVFETIKPGKYLNGSQYRPSHIHFKISPPNYPTITTQLYFEGDSDIEKDAAASIKTGTYDASHRIITLTKNTQGDFEGTWDIVVDGKGITGISDLHIDKGMIYNTQPNPFKGQLTIKYGVFKKANIGLLVFDSAGKTVASLKNEILKPEKYEAVWQPATALPAGIYFIALKVNDLQVHYERVVKIA